MKACIFDNGDFAYFARVEPIAPPVSGFALTLTSVLRSSKEPELEQVRLQACLPADGLKALADLIQTQLNASPTQGGL